MISSKPSVAVIGGGIIGVTTAAYLVLEGYQVTIIDREGIACSTSSGNAGAFAYVNIFPSAQPSVLLQAPKWFLDPLGPLAIPVGYIPTILPWLSRFVWACRPSQVKTGIEAMKQLMALSREQAEAFWQDWNLLPLIIRRGSLNVFEQSRNFNSVKAQWGECIKQGFEIQFLETDEIQSIEPSLDKRFKYAVRVLDWPTVTDPMVYTKTIAEKALEKGAMFTKQTATDLVINQDGAIKIKYSDNDSKIFDRLVIAAGAWSNRLTSMLGDSFPLDTERGYNTTLADPGIELNHMILFPEHAFVATPMTCGLRIGGANELAGTDYPPNYKRATNMLEKAKKFLPDLNDKNGTQWMGCRPSLPDSQPIIDYSTVSRNVVYAFGHGHYGLTQSAGTARLVTDLLNHKQPSISMKGLKTDRFKTN